MNTQQFAQLVPIPPSIQEQIMKLGSQVQPERATEVCRRAIAVWVVSRYLNRFGYGCDYQQSSCWNVVTALLTDLADLEVFEGDRFLGMVECIPMASDAETLEIPEQAVMDDRIAYIAVETNAENTWGAILGFTPALEVEFPDLSIPREDLLSEEKLLDLLEMADPLAEESLFSELKSYWHRWDEEQRLAIVAQLERALLLESDESFQVESAAQELESLLAQSAETEEKEEVVLIREGEDSSDRAELRSIVQRIFQSLRENLE